MRFPPLFAALVLLAACGTSPPTQYFALEPVLPHRPAQPVAGPPLTVDAVHLPPELDRLDIVRRGPDDRIQIGPNQRWAAPLDEMARRVLAQDLADRLPRGMLIAPDAPEPPGRLRGLVAILQEFDADAAGRIVLDGEWMVAERGTTRPGSPRHVHLEEAGGPNQAAAMSRALGRFADDIAAGLAATPDTAPNGARNTRDQGQ